MRQALQLWELTEFSTEQTATRHIHSSRESATFSTGIFRVNRRALAEARGESSLMIQFAARAEAEERWWAI
jgi:hypothetical protein